MQKFTTLTAVAAPLPLDNVDTDVIFPGRHLTTVKRTGLGGVAFEGLRYGPGGEPNAAFPLNQAAYTEARILLAGWNFGCGSSREHAVWALAGLGIRAVIAKSFGDIFRANCLRNGLLPVALPEADVEALMAAAADGEVSIELEKQEVTAPDGSRFLFEIDSFQKECLIAGLDFIDLTLKDDTAIAAFEARQAAEQPWLRAPGGDR